jgi:hypothetical protein
MATKLLNFKKFLEEGASKKAMRWTKLADS